MVKNILRRRRRRLWAHVSAKKLAIALLLLVASRADAQGDPTNQTIWTGAVSDDWLTAGNWTNGIPAVGFESSRRADIRDITDLANWPVIKNGQNITTGQRVWVPEAPYVGAETTYGRLTIESGGALTVGQDFRAAEGNDSGPEFNTPPQFIIASVNVAGTLLLTNRSRFGNSAYTTIDVDVTGTMIHNDPLQDFDIGGGDESSADFDISGNGLVSVTGEFGIFEGSLLSLSDNGKLTLNEYEYPTAEDENGDPIDFVLFTKAEILDSVAGFVELSIFEGLTDTYTGTETLIGLGNGLAYYEEATSLSFVAAPIEPPVVVDGDYNLDGLYDAADYVIWRHNAGDESAYEAWTTMFGTLPPEGGGNQSVPEPSTLGLLALAAMSLSVRRIRN